MNQSDLRWWFSSSFSRLVPSFLPSMDTHSFNYSQNVCISHKWVYQMTSLLVLQLFLCYPTSMCLFFHPYSDSPLSSQDTSPLQRSESSLPSYLQSLAFILYIEIFLYFPFLLFPSLKLNFYYFRRSRQKPFSIFYRYILYKSMESLKKQETNSTKITKVNNDKIIALIKSKINPLHSKPHRFPKLKVESVDQRPAGRKTKPIEHEIVNAKELKSYNYRIKYPKIQLVERTKKYLKEKKKTFEINNEEESRGDLSAYIRLFNEGEEEKEKKMMEEFLKMKRESINFMSQDEQTFNIADNSNEFPSMTVQEQVEMNAKIRKRINHKKIIALYKNR